MCQILPRFAVALESFADQQSLEEQELREREC
jgi:hypothetical protein